MKKFLSLQLLLILSTLFTNTFAQTSNFDIHVHSPNGGEYWTWGNYPAITWTAKNSSLLKIEISIDSGKSWTEISSAVSAENKSFSNWKVPNINSNKCLLKISDIKNPNLFDTSDESFRISTDTAKVNIVVLGSSTSAGVGPSKPDSSWVNKFRKYVFAKNTNYRVINLAVSGFSTYNVMPDNYKHSADRPDPKVNNNLTKALSHNPKAIIINLPSNDASSGIGVSEQLKNYKIIKSITDSLGIPVWVTTPQPRNFSEDKIKIQFEMLDSTYSFFKDMTIDFWTNIAESDGKINPKFNSGDGIHLNDDGHSLLLRRVLNENIVPNLLYVKSDFLEQNTLRIKIDFSIFKNDFYTIKIFNNLNEEIETLLKEELNSGKHELSYYPHNIARGKYSVKLFNKNRVINKQIITIK